MRDQVTILVSAGRGGSGIVSFRREKYVPRGGPDGGDGGRGGGVIISADDKIQNLESIRNRGEYRAEPGSAGAKSRKSGRSAENLLIRVPPGTAVFDEDTDEQLADLAAHGDSVIAAAGGSGGRGNCHFATPRNRVPQEWEPGAEGETRNIRLLFSMPADVAVVGLPDAGKSSLAGALTHAKIKIAEYPFTTRTPQIGICRAGPAASFKIIDMPALVEGSSEGRGIGNGFLNHLRRVRLIAYLIDATLPDGLTEEKQLKILRDEIAAYDPEFLNKKEMVIINKADAAETPGRAAKVKGFRGKAARVSAREKTGLEETVKIIADLLELDAI